MKVLIVIIKVNIKRKVLSIIKIFCIFVRVLSVVKTFSNAKHTASHIL